MLNQRVQVESDYECCYERVLLKDLIKKYRLVKFVTTYLSLENLYKNYVKSKEEIFLIVLEKEFTLWVDSFLLSNNQTSDISPDEFAKIWANSLSKRKKLLSLLVILQTIIRKM